MNTTDPLIERQRLFGNPERAQGQLSPDGSRISFLAPRDGVLNVWVAPIDPEMVADLSAARPITADTGRGIRNHFWSMDGRYVLYLQDRGGDEDFLLYSVEPDTGRERALTPFEKTTAQVLAISRHHPDRILVGLNNRDAHWHDVHELNLETGELRLIAKNAEGFAGYLADRDYNVRLAVRPRADGGSDLLLRDRDGEWQEFLSYGMEDAVTTQPIGLSGDGTRLFMLDSRERNTAALISIHLSTGERLVLGEDPKADVSDLLTDPVDDEPIAYAVNYQRPVWTSLDMRYAADIQRLHDALDGEIHVVSQTLDDSRWLVAAVEATRPGSYHLYLRETGELRFLFDTRPELADAPLTPMHPQVIATGDGLEMVSYLSLPRWSDPQGRGRPEQPLPMVLLVHGGPWARDAYGYHAQHQWLANRGYAVLSVNFRGSTGFGKKFVNAADGEWGRAMHQDLLEAVRWAVEQGVTAEGRVAIMGGSYGGYATLAGLVFTPDLFACGVDIVGPSNLETLIATIPPYWEAAFEQMVRRIGDPRTPEGQALLRERSPLHGADRIRRPLLIGQGANDPRVKQAESDQIVHAMKDNGLPVTYLLFPDEGHGFARPENRLAFYAVTEAFLAKNLGGRAEPIGDALQGSSVQVPQGAEVIEELPQRLRELEASRG